MNSAMRASLSILALSGVLSSCMQPPPPPMPPYNPTQAVEVCAGGVCGELGETFALEDVARAIGEMFKINGPGVWDFCLGERGTRRCLQDDLTYTVHGVVPATGHVPQGALRAGARYDGERGVSFPVNIPTIVFDSAAICDDARSTLSVRSSKNILWLSNPYYCSWGGGPHNIKAEGRYGIDFIDFDKGITGGEFVIRVTEGGNGFTTGYAVTKLSTGMRDSHAVWLRPMGSRPKALASRTQPRMQPQARSSYMEPLTPTRAAPSRFPEAPLVLTFPKGGPRPDDIAVIIGNADYGKHGRDIPDVVPARADAEGFKRYALQALGVREGNIIDLRDATSAQMVSVFGSREDHRGKLFNWTRPGRSRVYVYYSGHGAPAGNDGNAYLVPVDADASTIALNGYPLDTLYANLGKVPAQSITVVLEACFSGVSQGGSVISNASPVFLRPKVADVPPNVTVISAGAPNQMASWEEDKSHGLFTKYFLKAMSGEADGNKDGRVGNAELDAYLKDTLSYYARRYYGRDQHAQITVGNGGY